MPPVFPDRRLSVPCYRLPYRFASSGRAAADPPASIPDGSLLAVGIADGTVQIWDAAAKHLRGSFRAHPAMIQIMAFSPDGHTLATAGDDQSVKLWNVATLQQVAALRGPHGVALALAFAPDGCFLVTGHGDHQIRIWRAAPATPGGFEPVTPQPLQHGRAP